MLSNHGKKTKTQQGGTLQSPFLWDCLIQNLFFLRQAMDKPVKLNSTAILRQKTLHDRRAEEELQRWRAFIYL